MKRTYRSFIVALLLCALLLPAVALAASKVQALKGTYVYQRPSTSANIKGTLAKGEVVEKYGVRGSWTIVLFSGGAGYVRTADLQDYTGAVTGEQEWQTHNYMVSKDCTVRSAPNIDSARVGRLGMGEFITGEPIGNWVRFSYYGEQAYAPRANLLALPSSNTDETTDPPSQTVEDGDAMYVLKAADATQKAGSGKVTGHVKMGDQVVIKGESDRYALVEGTDAAGKSWSGYVPAANLVSGKGIAAFKAHNRWYYASTLHEPGYKVPILDKKYTQGYLAMNEAVFATKSNGEFVYAYADGEMTYIPLNGLLTYPTQGNPVRSPGPYEPGQTIKIPSGGKETYASSYGDAYYAPGASAAYGKIPAGTQVTVLYSTKMLSYVLWEEGRKASEKDPSIVPGTMYTAFITNP